MSKYTFKLYAVDWVKYTWSRVILSYMTPWNFLPSEFLQIETLIKYSLAQPSFM